MQQNPFGVLKNGDSIWTAELRHPVKTGITYEPLLPGTVSEYECREAAVYANLRPGEFWQLARGERAATVAQYRLSAMVRNYTDDAVSEAVERRGKQT